MKIILDSANIEDIKRYSHISKMVTTNPILLENNGIKSYDHFYEFSKYVNKHAGIKEIFYQCFNEEDVDFVAKINNELSASDRGLSFIAKITMTNEFFHLIEKSQELDLVTAATTCYDLNQIHEACEIGMEYSMVYFAKNDNETLLADAVKMKKDYNYQTILVAASFRTKKDYISAIKSGIQAATVQPYVLDLVFKNNDVEDDIREFQRMKGFKR